MSSAIPNPLPATYLRGGTSKGVFINHKHLPDDRNAWAPVFLSLMGSPDAAYGRQLNGMGGGVSSLSKVMVVGPPKTAEVEVDAEYTFAQIGVRDVVVDYTGNCGNLSSIAGVFAVDEGICKPELVEDGGSYGPSSPFALARVRLWNTNTRKRVDTTFPVSRNTLEPVLNLEETTVAGVSGSASRIVLEFVSPAGTSAPAGTLLPTTHASERVKLSNGIEVTVTLMDCTNPTVLVDMEASPALFQSARGEELTALDVDLESNSELMSCLEQIRQEGARLMGLDPSAQAQPKVAIISAPRRTGDRDEDADVYVRALSMGVPHKAVPMTLGLCVGVAGSTPGTIVARHIHTRDTGFVRIRHPGGLVEVGARFDSSGHVLAASVVRTGRRLMSGAVFWD
ncbi:DUF453-domain-containing protein [Exidia glandulosa HHB12029]|uniref:DUF453-domain-containing protein n=1 Tax=Exidia glandulosa HHB12029 TaxID=1314781 RepID=A0A166ASF2_EXIGL|nr:DUF453-domain-containing protein [Exidia glandulosa HHB12029]